MKPKQNSWFDDEQHEETPTGLGPQLMALSFTVGGMLFAAAFLFTPDVRSFADTMVSSVSLPDRGSARGALAMLFIEGALIGAILGAPAGVIGLGVAAYLRHRLTNDLWPKVPIERLGLCWSAGGGGFAVVVWWVAGRWG